MSYVPPLLSGLALPTPLGWAICTVLVVSVGCVTLTLLVALFAERRPDRDRAQEILQELLRLFRDVLTGGRR